MPDKYYEYKSLETNLGSFYSFDSTCYQVRISFDYTSYSDIVHHFDFLKNSTSFGILSKKLDDVPEAGHDKLIGDTISKIVGERFSKEKNPEQNAIVIYHCDWLDGKQHIRSRKFTGWYIKSTLSESLTHLSECVIIEGVNHFIGILYHTDNPNAESIKNEFYKVIEFIATYEYLKTRGHEQEEAITDGETDRGL